MWNGNVVRWPNNFFIKTPDSYYELQNTINSIKDDSKILTLPMTPVRMKSLNWGYMGVDLFELLFNKSMLNYNDISVKLLGIRLDGFDQTVFPIIAKIFNIERILLDTHENRPYEAKILKYNNRPTELTYRNYAFLFTKYLKKYIATTESFNGFYIHKLNNSYFLPHIYATKKASVILGDSSIFKKLCTENLLFDPPLFISTKQNKNIVNINSILSKANLIVCESKKILKLNIDYLVENVIHIFSGTIKQRKFYTNQDGKYTLRCKLIPNLTNYDSKDRITLNLFNLIKSIKIDKFSNTSGWLKLDSLKNIVISNFYDGPAKEDEYSLIKIDNIDIDLVKYPILKIDCKVENSIIQVFDIIAKIAATAAATIRSIFSVPCLCVLTVNKNFNNINP